MKHAMSIQPHVIIAVRDDSVTSCHTDTNVKTSATLRTRRTNLTHGRVKNRPIVCHANHAIMKTTAIAAGDSIRVVQYHTVMLAGFYSVETKPLLIEGLWALGLRRGKGLWACTRCGKGRPESDQLEDCTHYSNLCILRVAVPDNPFRGPLTIGLVEYAPAQRNIHVPVATVQVQSTCYKRKEKKKKRKVLGLRSGN